MPPAELTTCLVCGDAGTRPYAEKSRFGTTWRIRRCGACGLGFVANRPTLGQLQAIYETDVHLKWDTPTPESHEAHPDAPRLARHVARLAPLAQGGARSLDVGCGDGAFSYHLAKYGFRPTLIDFDPRSEAAAATVPGATFHRRPLEDMDEPQAFGAIVMSQVLEHAIDPLDWLRRARAMLAPGGVLAVAVPNFAGVYGLLGRRDPFLIPPVHLNFFTPDAMRRAFAAAGLRVVRTGSASHVNVGERPSLRSRVLRGAWNRLAPPLLNHTQRGIILEVFGTPA